MEGAKKPQGRGFTIIELMIVIVVIGILAGITLLIYGNVATTTRDSQRTSDVTQLKIAIEKYKADNGQYPPCQTDDQPCEVVNLASELAPYLANIPTDPTSVSPGDSQDYVYIRSANPSTYGYGIQIQYETSPACYTGQNPDPTWWPSESQCSGF